MRSAELRRILGWNEQIPLRVLCQQLHAYSNLAASEKIQDVEDTAATDTGEHEQDTTGAKSAAIVPLIYKLISEAIPSNEFDLCKSELTSMKCILVNEAAFVRPSSVAFQSTVDVRPYLFTLPPALLPFQRLFRELGVREKFVPHDYANVLVNMRSDYPDEELPPDLLRTALTLVQLLADSIINEVPFVPDAHGKLVMASDLVSMRCP